MARVRFRDYESDKREIQSFLKEFCRTELDGKKHFPYLEQLVVFPLLNLPPA